MPTIEPTAADLRPFFNQLHELEKGVLGGRLPLTQVKASLDEIIAARFGPFAGHAAVTVTGGFSLVVDLDRSIADMVAAGGYDGYVEPAINDQNFPIVGMGKAPAEAVLVHLNREASDDEVLAEIDRQGLRAGIIPELLAFGETYPELQRQFPIAALGSVWTDPNGNRFVGYLWGGSSGRDLSLRWLGSRWGRRCRFLAFRK